MSQDLHVNRQNAIEAACHKAIEALWAEATAAMRDQRVMDSRLGLAEALEAIERDRTAGRSRLSAPFTISDCIAHLRATASPRRSS